MWVQGAWLALQGERATPGVCELGSPHVGCRNNLKIKSLKISLKISKKKKKKECDFEYVSDQGYWEDLLTS